MCVCVQHHIGEKEEERGGKKSHHRHLTEPGFTLDTPNPVQKWTKREEREDDSFRLSFGGAKKGSEGPAIRSKFFLRPCN